MRMYLSFFFKFYRMYLSNIIFINKGSSSHRASWCSVSLQRAHKNSAWEGAMYTSFPLYDHVHSKEEAKKQAYHPEGHPCKPISDHHFSGVQAIGRIVSRVHHLHVIHKVLYPAQDENDSWTLWWHRYSALFRRGQRAIREVQESKKKEAEPVSECKYPQPL